MLSKIWYWFTKDDWNTNEANVQSDVAVFTIPPQFIESDNHIWSFDLYVKVQFISKKESLDDDIKYLR